MSVTGRARGYTIVEVMIFLAVSASLFVVAAALISGQQGKSEFNQSLNDIESKIRDVSNDVSNGFYPNTNSFKCTTDGTGSGPTISVNAGNTQGTNLGCIFIGRVLHFGVSGTSGVGYNLYTVAGQRLIGGAGSNEVTSLLETKPVAVAIDSNGKSAVNAIDSLTLQSRMIVSKMYYTIGATTTNITALGFFSTFSSYANGNLSSGSQSVQLVPIPGPTTTPLNTLTSQTAADLIDSFASGAYDSNPVNGVVICFVSSGSNQYGQITIGSNGRELTTKRTVGTGACP